MQYLKNNAFVQFSMTNAVPYVSIYLFNESITIYLSSQAMHFHRQKEKKIIQRTNRALFNLIIILPLLNLTYAFDAQDNKLLAQSRWAAGRYIYIRKICTRLVYTTDIVPLGYESVCHNSTFVRLLMVYQFILNSNSNN